MTDLFQFLLGFAFALGCALIFATACFALLGVLRLARWLYDRYWWMRWFSL